MTNCRVMGSSSLFPSDVPPDVSPLGLSEGFPVGIARGGGGGGKGGRPSNGSGGIASSSAFLSIAPTAGDRGIPNGFGYSNCDVSPSIVDCNGSSNRITSLALVVSTSYPGVNNPNAPSVTAFAWPEGVSATLPTLPNSAEPVTPASAADNTMDGERNRRIAAGLPTLDRRR